MEDGSIVINTEIDDKAAQKKLIQLQNQLRKLEDSTSQKESQHNALAEELKEAQDQAIKTYEEVEKTKEAIAEAKQQQAEVQATLSGANGDTDPVKYLEALDKQQEINAVLDQQTAKLKEQETLLAQQERAAQKIEAQDAKVVQQIEQENQKLEETKSQIGEINSQLAQTSSSNLPAVREAMASMNTSINTGFKNFLKWGLGIRSVFLLVKKLRSAIVESVQAFAEYDSETSENIASLKTALNGLKVSWGAAFAPILNAVTPILQSLISWLTAAANAVTKLFAVLNGQSSYKKFVASTGTAADNLSSGADSAEEMKRQVMGFDELNVLSADTSTSSSGGGTSDTADGDVIEEAIDQTSFVARLAATVKDVFFDWSDLTEEQIAEKAVAGAAMIFGTIIGGMIGGVPGAIIGLVAGAIFGLSADALIFNGNGKLDEQEVVKMVALVLGTIIGGAIGSSIGPVGTLIGMTIGFTLTLTLTTVDWGWVDSFKSLWDERWDDITQMEEESGLESGGALVDGAKKGIIASMITLEWMSEHIFIPVVKWFKQLFGIHSPSTVFAELGGNITDGLKEGITNKWSSLMSKFETKLEELKKSAKDGVSQLKEAFNFEWSLPHIKLPHFSIAGQFSLYPPSIPTISVSWYAKGGIVDGATLFGNSVVGEDGKEAIIPLERHTEWIKMVAEELLDMLTGNDIMSMVDVIADSINEIPQAIDRLTAAFSSVPMPAMATGTVVPPNAVSYGYGDDMSEDISDIKAKLELLYGILETYLPDGNDLLARLLKKPVATLDGKQLKESISNYERARGQ